MKYIEETSSKVKEVYKTNAQIMKNINSDQDGVLNDLN
jgi:hypothetical protein